MATDPGLPQGQLLAAVADKLDTAGTASGAVDDPAETDPAEDATVIALLKGILTVLNSIDSKTPAP